MVSSDEDAAALIAELEKAKRELETEKGLQKRENEAKLDRLWRERLVGTSFDGLGGGNSSDRRGIAASTMGPIWTRRVSATGGLRQSLPNFPRGIVSKIPVECSPSEYIAFIADQGLRHTISPDAPEIAVISCTNNAYLFGHFGEDLVTNHRRVWGYISEATAGATFEDRLYKCHSISDALRIMREWPLPLHPAERNLLVEELERVQFMGDEDPNFFSAPTFHLETTMRAVGIEKDASKLFSSFSASSRNVHRIPMLLSSVMVFGAGGPWESESNEGMTIWYLATVACLSSSSSNGLAVVAFLGSRSSYSNIGLAAVACLGSSSSHCNTGLATVACRGSSSCSNTGLATVACRGSSAATLASRRYHAAAAAAAATLASRRWHAAAAAAAAALVSRWCHAAAAAATAAMVSGRWDSSSAST